MESLTLERQTNSGPVDVVRQAVYAYYDGSQPYGNAGDLMLAVVLDGNGNAIDTTSTTATTRRPTPAAPAYSTAWSTTSPPHPMPA